jgi:SAM-dependent methyltransferase
MLNPYQVTALSEVDMESVACAVCDGRDLARTVSIPDDEFLSALGKAQSKSTWVICKTCGLVFQSPRITADDEQRLYSGRTYYQVGNVLTERYIANRLDKPRRILNWLRETKCFEDRSSRSFLEIGCGIGGALSVFQEAGWNAIGVEPDKDMAQFGAERFGVRITPGFFEAGMYESGRFDLVYTNHAYEHFRDPRAITSAIADVLQPNGYLFIAVPTYRRATGVMAWQWMNAAHTYLYTHVSLGNLVGMFGLRTQAWRYSPEGSEIWFLARKTGEVEPRSGGSENWREVRRTLMLHPLRHLFASPRGWPTVAQCYVEELAGPRVAAGAISLGRRLRRLGRAQR